MTRGADRRLRNSSNQTPNQVIFTDRNYFDNSLKVAIMCGHHQLAKEILGFDESTIGMCNNHDKISVLNFNF